MGQWSGATGARLGGGIAAAALASLSAYLWSGPVAGTCVALAAVLWASWSGGRGWGCAVAALDALAFGAFGPDASPGSLAGLGAFLLTSYLLAEFAAVRRWSEAARGRAESWNGLLVKSAREGVWVVDVDGRTTYVSPRMAEMLGYTPVEMTGQALHEFVIDRARIDTDLDPRRPGSGHAAPIEVRLRRSDGSKLWAALSAQPVPPWGGGGLLLTVEDVTRRWRAEKDYERAMRELRSVQSRHGRLVESNIIGIITAGLAGEVVEANDAFLRMVDYSAEDVRHGRVRWADMTPEEYRPRDQRAIDELWAAGACSPYEKEFIARGGRRVPVLIGAAALERFPRRWVGFVLDLSERKRAEDALRQGEQRYRQLFEANPHPMWIYDVETLRFLAVNDTAVRAYGYTRDEFLARTIADIRPPEDVPALRGRASALRGAAYLSAAGWRHLKKDGTVIDVEITSQSLDFSGRPARMVMATDVTERRRAEAEVRAAKEAAEAASRAKDRFLAVLSHELRTPLTPVLMAVSALLEDGVPPGLRGTLEMVRRNVELEARLIDDLLDVTRIGRGTLHLDPRTIDAHEAVRQAVDICLGEIEQGRIALELDLAAPEHFVEADPARLQQVVWNLLRNAAKFTLAGGTIAVRSNNPNHTGAGGRPRLAVEVRDTGVGIDAESLPRIFEPFEQGETSARHRSGMGLGLAIGRSLAEAHGGSLTATSPGPGRGSTFVLELPTVPRAAVQKEQPAEAVPPRRDGLRILLVEDNPDTLRYIGVVLQARGHEVTTAARLSDALREAEGRDLDLILSDIELPDGTGLELMRELRDRGVPGVAMSGYGSEEDVRASRGAGFAEHLTKPVDVAKLEAAIQRVAPAGGTATSGRAAPANHVGSDA
jgi:PAS domain S-box-containing protein